MRYNRRTWLRTLALLGLGSIGLDGCGIPDVPSAEPTTLTQPTSAPTPSPGIAFSDPLDGSQQSELRVGTTESGIFAFAKNHYTINAADPNAFVWSMFGGVYTNLLMSVNMAFMPNTNTVAGGLMFRASDANNFYLFNISNDGFYALDVRKQGSWHSLIEWTNWDAIATSGGTNALGINLQADTLKLELNQKLLVEVSDSSLSAGRLGLAVTTFESGGATISFDHLHVTPT